MAKTITQDEIIQMNELYLQLGTYSGVAKATGRAASTVKKYIVKDYVPQSELVKKIFKLIDIKDEFNPEPFIESDDWGKMAILSDEEKEGMKEIWKENSI